MQLVELILGAHAIKIFFRLRIAAMRAYQNAIKIYASHMRLDCHRANGYDTWRQATKLIAMSFNR